MLATPFRQLQTNRIFLSLIPFLSSLMTPLIFFELSFIHSSFWYSKIIIHSGNIDKLSFVAIIFMFETLTFFSHFVKILLKTK